MIDGEPTLGPQRLNHMGPRLSHTVATFALFVAACGAPPMAGAPEEPSTTVPPSPATTQPPPSTAAPDPIMTGDLEVIVLPGPDGDLPPDLMVTCRAGPEFPIGALEEITPLADGDPGGVAEAIEPFLRNEEGRFWPQEDWLILHRSESEILLVNQTDDSGLAFMTVTRTDSSWMWNGASMGGPCPLYYTVPDGVNTVEWRLDPAADLDPESMEITVLLSELECVSGQEIGERLLGPQIVMTDTTVHIAFAAEPPPGDIHTCQGIAEQPYVVELPVPVGSRQIVEGHQVGINLEDFLD